MKPLNIQYKKIFNHTLDAILLADDRAHYIDANPAACLLLGYSLEEIQTLSVWDVIPGVEVRESQALWQAFIESGHQRGEYQLKRKDGSQVAVEYVAVANIHPGYHVTVMRDISERRHLENQLLELAVSEEQRAQSVVEHAIRLSEERYRTISEMISDLAYSFRVDPDGRLTDEWVTGAFEQITGYKPSEIEGLDFFLQLVHPDDLPVIQEALKALVAGQERTVEYRIITRDSNVRWLLDHARPIWNGEHTRIVRILGAAQDITARKQAEEKSNRHIARLQSLADASRAFAESRLEQGDLDKALKVVAQVCAEKIGDTCVITLVSEDEEWLRPVAFYNTNPEALAFARTLLPSVPYPLDKGLVSQTIHNRKPLMIQEIPQDEIRKSLPPQYRHWLNKFGLHSILIVPLLVHDHLIGTIGVSRDRQGRPYQDEDLLFLQDLADRMALAIQNERLFSKMQQNSQQLARSNSLISALIQVAGRLLVVLNADQIIQILCDELKNNQVQSVIALFDPEDRSFVVQNSSIEPAAEERIRSVTGKGVQGLRLNQARIPPLFNGQTEQRQAVFIDDLLVIAQKIFPEMKPEWVEQNLKWIGISEDTRAISVPLAVDSQMMGFIAVWSSDLREEDLPVFSIFASQTTIALENARLFQQVRSGRERLQAVSRQLVNVQEQERRQIARELHDEIGQILTGLNFLLESSANLPVERVKENLDEARSIVNNLMNEVREISLNLRPAMLDDLGLLPALLWHVNRYTQQTGIFVNLKQHRLSKCRFSPQVETAAYRIIQEALTNVARHAGVNVVDVRIRVNEDSLSIQIDDLGKGFDVANTLDSYITSGISGMQERANLVGGRLIITSSPESGTRLLVELPISERLERRTNDRLDHVSG